MKTTTLALSLVTTLLLVGCGDSTSSTPIETPPETPITANSTTTDITVERGPVLNAALRDANGTMGQPLGHGVYRFTDVTYPVESYGGYIDMDRDGNISAGDIKMDQLRLKTNSGTVMTLATTLDANVTQLLLDINYTQAQLAGKTPTLDMDIAALSDELYKYCVENNITNPSLIDNAKMQTLQGKIYDRKSRYATETRSPAELELILMDELHVSTLTESELLEVPATPMQTLLETLPIVALSDEQKHTLAYMWNEERLAKDIYLALYSIYPTATTFSNIAINGETQHITTVENIIKKYDLNILNTTDYSGGYSQEALATYNAGEYSLPVITDLYNTLYTKGVTSVKDALEVGCMVEVTDVNDLNEQIKVAGNAQDLVIAFENLKSGSYSHYWAFDNALKTSGVSEGCCTLGATYCKTTTEYPQASHGSESTQQGNGQQRGKH